MVKSCPLKLGTLKALNWHVKHRRSNHRSFPGKINWDARLLFKVFFILKYIKIIFFLLLKDYFNITKQNNLNKIINKIKKCQTGISHEETWL
jgi:hypothetical protein